MGLWINDSGASETEIRKGISAAADWFNQVELDPETEWNAFQADNDRSTDLWSQAELAAFKAAFEGWEEWPEAAALIWE